MAQGWLSGARDGERLLIAAGGSWTLDQLRHLDAAQRSLLALAGAGRAAARLDLSAVAALDTVGAWLLHRLEHTLGIPPGQFVGQLGQAITLETFLVGLVKAPVFAFLIGLVGCYQGLSVSGSAESVGQLTTRSVVLAIFLVIVCDALFSILFSYLGI